MFKKYCFFASSFSFIIIQYIKIKNGGKTKTEVYIEFVIIENFLVDGAILWVTFFAAKCKLSVFRLFLAASLGCVFATIFPLIKLSKILLYIIKISFGVLIPLAASDKNAQKKFMIILPIFYVSSFAFAGCAYALCNLFSVDAYFNGGYIISTAPVGGVLASFVFCFAVVIFIVKRLYRRQKIVAFIYDCEIVRKKTIIREKGFYDSGNLATKNGKPIVFISPDVAYELLGDDIMTEEVCVTTASGEKNIKIFTVDKFTIYCGNFSNIIENTYFSPSNALLGREYKILFGIKVEDGKEMDNEN